MKTLFLGPCALHPSSRLSAALRVGAGVVSLTSLGSSAWAQGAPDEAAKLPPVTVTATRSPMRVDQSIAEVTVLRREDIEQATGRTLSELLSRQPGIQFTSNGGLGKNSALFIHGLEARHTLLLVDGVRYGSATAGTPSLDNFSLDSIERIEIVRGPLSSLYGSDAVGGVIQIFTRRGHLGLQVNGAVGAGSQAYAKATAGLGFGDERWDAALQVTHVETRGFSATNPRVQFGNFNGDNDGFRQDSATAQVGLKFAGDWRLGVKVMQSNGVTGIDDGPGLNALSKLGSEVLALDLAGSPRPGWHSVTRVSSSMDKSAALNSASPFTDIGAFKTLQQQLSQETTVETGLGTALLVVDYLKQKVSKPAAQYDVTERNIVGVAAGLDGRHGAHTWQASLRHDHNSQFGNQDSGAVGYGFDLTPRWRIGASYGTSFVAPSFNQLYYPNFGNPNLVPEEGKSAELSLRYALQGHEVRAALFEHRIRGYISSGPQPVNVPKTRIDGVSLSYQGQVLGIDTRASLDHVDPRNKTPGPNDDKLLPRRAKNSGTLELDRKRGAFGLGTSVRGVGSRYDNAANSLTVERYVTADLRAEWRFLPQWTVTASLNNLADKRYETVYGYNQPGREGYLTLRYSER